MAYLPAEAALLDNPRQIDTSAFKRWFGDSKVVDAKGLPLVVYHGTSSLDFSAFKPGSGSASGAAAFGTGIYFSDSAKKVSVWSGKKQGARIYPVYLSIQNPAIFKSESEYFKAAGFTYDRFFGDVEKRDAFNATLKAKGHDGIIVNRTQLSGKTKEYVVFEPTQIKSATGNRGTFDPSDPDIRNPRTTPPQFPYRYAAYLKAHFPEIWKAGGNIRGNDTYRWWTAYRQGDRSPTVMHWWNVTRPAWIARHYRDHRLPGVIAQIKWGTVGTLGVSGMKRVVEDAIRRRYAR